MLVLLATYVFYPPNRPTSPPDNVHSPPRPRRILCTSSLIFISSRSPASRRAVRQECSAPAPLPGQGAAQSCLAQPRLIGWQATSFNQPRPRPDRQHNQKTPLQSASRPHFLPSGHDVPRTMASKRNRVAIEAELQAAQSPFVFYGTPLPPIDPNVRDDGSYVPEWEQEVRDERGRKRLHGAFTGGWSAGLGTIGDNIPKSPLTFCA